ncbi:hypothetical protein AX17_001580 [Amanita inopinata Kibby_2008]|nr:hypothetical protein AX17_001580 [Amanita inopinata Kibby_2008]
MRRSPYSSYVQDSGCSSTSASRADQYSQDSSTISYSERRYSEASDFDNTARSTDSRHHGYQRRDVSKSHSHEAVSRRVDDPYRYDYRYTRDTSNAYAPASDYVLPMAAAAGSSHRSTAPSPRMVETPPAVAMPQAQPEKKPPSLHGRSGPRQRRTSPSPEYLDATLQPSTRLADPASTRKLLILDLNGTLVFRSPHKQRTFRSRGYVQRREKHKRFKHEYGFDYGSDYLQSASFSSSQQSEVFDPYADPVALRPLRPVHPRPFMDSLRRYLFHSNTCSWLDTMVWSSAQPHSVADMVERCFEGHKDELVAVWARDTLGLSEDDYHRKTQTTKDLTKPWTFLSSSRSSLDSSKKTRSSTKATTTTASAESAESPTLHSAYTTILLDDSPLKAQLQPWNHVCIKEYEADMRKADIETATTLIFEASSTMRRTSATGDQEVVAISKSVTEMESYKLPRADATLAEDDGIGRVVTETEAEVEEFDDGKSGEQGQQKKRKRTHERKVMRKLSKQDKAQRPALRVTGDEEEVEERSREAEEWWRSFDCTLLAVVGVLDAVKRESNVAAWIRQGGLRKRSENTSQREPGDRMSADSSGVSSSAEDKGRAPKRQKVLSSANSCDAIADLVGEEEEDREGLWFEDEDTMAYWVARGVRALQQLDIELVPGIKT